MKIHYKTVPNNSPDGYGTSSRYIRAALDDVGIQCTDNEADIALVYQHPEAIQYAKGKKIVLYTMFESTRPPERWREWIDKVDVLVNPTEWGARTFEETYQKECKVVPLGIDTNNFTLQKRVQSDVFTFLQYDCNRRKGFLETWEAFRLEFEKEAEEGKVEIIFKTSNRIASFPPGWPGMLFINEDATIPDLIKLLQRANCFVFPSRGEGFGHTPLEAMATGLPVISINQHGISSYWNNECMFGVDSAPIEAQYDYIHENDLGYMYKADIDDLRRKMREVYNMRSELDDIAPISAVHAQQFTYKRTAEGLKNIMEEL